jgi:hypothetical protein
MINNNTVYLEPRKYLDCAIVGYDLIDECLIYEYCLLIDAYMDMGCTYDDASDHINYNIISMTPNKYWPIIQDEI